jgi:hypothetical protein
MIKLDAFTQVDASYVVCVLSIAQKPALAADFTRWGTIVVDSLIELKSPPHETALLCYS